MKPLRELSTEQLEELSDDQIIEHVANDIQSSRATGADLREEHIALAPWLKELIDAEWDKEIEWRAKPKPTFRRFTKPSSFLPATQPEVE